MKPQDQIEYEYAQSQNPNWTFGTLLFGTIMAAIIWVGIPMFVATITNNPVIIIGSVAAGILLTVIVPFLVGESASQQFFDNPDIHTHDDDCSTCGLQKTYGPLFSAPPYVVRMAHKCRHSSGQMKYPE